MVSHQIQNAINEAPLDLKFMHAATYSGHPMCCAVGLANVGDHRTRGAGRARRAASAAWFQDAAASAARAAAGRRPGARARHDGRGRAGRSQRHGQRVLRQRRGRGRAGRGAVRRRMASCRGDQQHDLMAPPLISTEEQLSRLVEVLAEAIQAEAPTLSSRPEDQPPTRSAANRAVGERRRQTDPRSAGARRFRQPARPGQAAPPGAWDGEWGSRLPRPEAGRRNAAVDRARSRHRGAKPSARPATASSASVGAAPGMAERARARERYLREAAARRQTARGVRLQPSPVRQLERGRLPPHIAAAQFDAALKQPT